MVGSYQVEFLLGAVEDLKKLDKLVAQRVVKKVRWLAENFDTAVPEPLSGQFKGAYKLRVGDWRVIYSVPHKKRLITIHLVGHRREIYR
jgi:mRNA interferase RelE/StbE